MEQSEDKIYSPIPFRCNPVATLDWDKLANDVNRPMKSFGIVDEMIKRVEAGEVKIGNVLKFENARSEVRLFIESEDELEDNVPILTTQQILHLREGRLLLECNGIGLRKRMFDGDDEDVDEALRISLLHGDALILRGLTDYVFDGMVHENDGEVRVFKCEVFKHLRGWDCYKDCSLQQPDRDPIGFKLTSDAVQDLMKKVKADTLKGSYARAKPTAKGGVLLPPGGIPRLLDGDAKCRIELETGRVTPVDEIPERGQSEAFIHYDDCAFTKEDEENGKTK